MTILSDITIRELCDRPISPREYFMAAVREDENFRAAVIERAKGVNHPVAFTELELISEANRRFQAQDFGMIYPFIPHQIKLIKDAVVDESLNLFCDRKIISKGTTSYGYDVSLTDDVKVFTNINGTEIDPKRFDEQNCLVQAEVRRGAGGSRYVLLPPHSYMLASTQEYFRIPRDVMVICLGKSTYARCGAIVNTTPIEPGFEGNVVIEIANTAPLPCRIYLDEGIAQFLFLRGDRPCEVSYGDRGGKYQGQTGVTSARV